MKIAYDKLPTELSGITEKLSSARDIAEEIVGALVLALCIYPRDKNLSLEIISYLRDTPMSLRDTQFLNERMRGKDQYLGNSYLSGASPENGYSPSIPFEISISENPYSHGQEGYVKLFVETKGADSPRPVTLKKTDKGWLLWEYSSLLTDVKRPN